MASIPPIPPSPGRGATSEITGLILAGGHSRRMGGLAKGRLPLRGKALIAHAIDRLAPQVAEVMISANGPDYDDLGLHVVADIISDDVSGRAGPLAGLHAGLLACETQWLVTAPCDAPFLPLDLVARLAAEKSASQHWTTSAARSDAPRNPAAVGRRLFVAKSPRGLEPGFMFCHVSMADELERWLKTGGRKAQSWLAEHAALSVIFPESHAFANINTPEDLAACAGATTLPPCD